MASLLRDFAVYRPIERPPSPRRWYTFKPLGHAFPARCPARVLLSRVPLGPFPWLRRFRPATSEVNLCDLRFVRRPLRYYGRV